MNKEITADELTQLIKDVIEKLDNLIKTINKRQLTSNTEIK